MTDLARIKQGARATWAAGDFPTVARLTLWEVGPRIVAAVGIDPGDEVLDVACGTGNAAIRAAEAGARVTGVDLTPELFEAGRREAAGSGVALEWVQGDAEELPFEDESFDVVLSTFGCMFAPRHAVAAAEIARVLRPGGRLGITAWTPEGGMGSFFRTVGTYMPPPPPIAQPPALWGSEHHVRELFAGSDVYLEFRRDTVEQARFESTDEAIEYMATRFGPMMMAREMLTAAGRWDDLRADLVTLYERDEPLEYLVTLGRKGW
ncbi:MAG TPA: methyltransferase domain-containing protein [Gaiellales bacterium]|nr:methyltransferase domain-containing protein [Gaiellales bacterium]